MNFRPPTIRLLKHNLCFFSYFPPLLKKIFQGIAIGFVFLNIQGADYFLGRGLEFFRGREVTGYHEGTTTSRLHTVSVKNIPTQKNLVGPEYKLQAHENNPQLSGSECQVRSSKVSP